MAKKKERNKAKRAPMESVLSAYRNPRAYEPAIRISQKRAQEREMLARKAHKDEADLKAVMLYTHQDDGPSRPGDTDRRERTERTDRAERTERTRGNERTEMARGNERTASVEGRARKKNRHEIAIERDKEYMRNKHKTDEAGLRLIERELLYDDDEPVFDAARLVLNKHKEVEHE